MGGIIPFISFYVYLFNLSDKMYKIRRKGIYLGINKKKNTEKKDKVKMGISNMDFRILNDNKKIIDWIDEMERKKNERRWGLPCWRKDK